MRCNRKVWGGRVISAERIESVLTVCHLIGIGVVEGPATEGGKRDSPKFDTVPEVIISCKRVTSLFASLARLRLAGVISVRAVEGSEVEGRVERLSSAPNDPEPSRIGLDFVGGLEDGLDSLSNSP